MLQHDVMDQTEDENIHMQLDLIYCVFLFLFTHLHVCVCVCVVVRYVRHVCSSRGQVQAPLGQSAEGNST